MDEQKRAAGDSQRVFSLIAGSLCLDFVNTVGGRRGGRTEEHLRTYADLARWAQQAGLLAPGAAERLLDVAGVRPDEASAVHARAIALREALYQLFIRLLGNAEPPPADLAVLNAELSRSLGRLALDYAPGDGFAWRWIGEADALDRMLWPVARSAAELLISPTAHTLRQCAGASCGWLFIDATKNRSRRWCDMRGCGNRAKVRRHRERGRSEPASGAESDHSDSLMRAADDASSSGTDSSS